MRAFARRIACSGVIAAGLFAFSLVVGLIGYHVIGGLSWLDSLLNASMILTAMGPVDRMESVGGKLFSAGYAVFSGLMFMTAFTVISAPILHRMMHRFHIEGEKEEGE